MGLCDIPKKVYQNKSCAKNNSQNFFIVKLRPFLPDLQKTGPDIRIHRCPVSLFALVPRVTADLRACASGRSRRRDFHCLSLFLSFLFLNFSFPFFLFLFFSLSLSLSPSSLSSAALPHARRAA